MASTALLVTFVLATLALQFGPLRGRPLAERWLLATSTAVLALAVASLAALRAGWHSPWLGSGALLAVAAIAWKLRGAARSELPAPPPEQGAAWLASALVCLGALYAFYPVYFLLGGQDPGVYLLLAAHGAKTGGLNVDLPWAHAAWSNSAGALSPGYPGIYSLVADGFTTGPDRLVPQFMHLFPALASNAWPFGGVEAVLRVNAVLAVLALWGLFVLVRRFVTWQAALALVLLLGLNPAFIWGARITLTEIMALWLNVFGLLLLDLARSTRARGFAVAAGAVLAAGVFNRFDAALGAFALLGFAAAGSVSSDLRPRARVAAAVYLIVVAVAFVDGRIAAPVYFVHLTQRHSLYGSIGLSAACGLVSFGLTLLPDRLVERVLRAQKLSVWTRAGAWALWSGWFVWVLLLWPALSHSSDAQNGRELTWYVTPVVWPLALAGIALALRSDRLAAWLPILSLAAASTVVFLLRTGVAPEHIWASRRWLPLVIPLLMLLAVAGGDALVSGVRLRRSRILAGAAALVVYLVGALDFARPFLFRSMLAGLPEAYARFARYTREAEVRTPLVTNQLHLASILTYVYDVPTMLLSESGRIALARGELEGRFSVGLTRFQAGSALEYEGAFTGKYLEGTATERPRAIVDLPVALDLARLSGPAFELEIAAGDPAFGTIVGKKARNGVLKTTGRRGTLQNGPWIELSPGLYEVDWLGFVWKLSKKSQSGTIDVITGGGAVVLGEAPLQLARAQANEAWLGGVDFALERPISGVEFRMQVEEDTELSLSRVRLRRVAVRPPEWVKVR